MKTSPSLLGRALLAVVLMIGFYLLAAGIVFGLFWIPYAEIVYAHRVTPKLALICIIAGVTILWSVLPRLDKFLAPGPRLQRAQYPQLFEQLDAVARATRQEMPAEVYLIPDVNAWVMQRGGLMGFGSRRVMGLGLPLMRVLSCSQFRAVLAHEFGHYHGGDTKVGPWIYKTRSAIMRTLSNLGGGSWIQKPFLWYAKMFLRITHAISRRQEFLADELAARVIGARPLMSGLRTIHGAGSVFHLYWRNECAPVLRAGFCPPLAEGFDRFVHAQPIEKAIGEQLEEELKNGKADPYDTHPPLRERIAAVEHLPAGPVELDDPPAVSLLADVPALEQQLLSAMVPAEAAKLKPVAWQDVCSHVFMPQWRKLVEANAAALNGITPEALPALAADLKVLGRKFVFEPGQPANENNAEALAGGVIGAALLVALAGSGGKIQTSPGESVLLILGSIKLEPFGLMQSLAKEAPKADEWRNQIAGLGLAGVDLGKAVKDGVPISLPSPVDDQSRYMPKP
jgi:Zn-dependent protease with chaperone function